MYVFLILQKIQDVFNYFDVDNSGYIEYNEFISILKY